MEHFDLICIASECDQGDDVPAREHREIATDTSSNVSTNYYVPSLFDSWNVKDQSDLALRASVTFFVDFNGLFTSKIRDTF